MYSLLDLIKTLNIHKLLYERIARLEIKEIPLVKKHHKSI